MANTNINSLTQTNSIDEENNLILLTNSDTNTGSVITVGDFKTQIQPGLNRYTHNRYRGKNLGTSFTSEQSANIKNGSFEDLYVGDYWVINGVTWRIGAINPAYNCGDTNLTTNHVLILPDTNLYNHQMSYTESGTYEAGSVNTTASGYANAYGRTTGLTEALNMFVSAFGDEHIITYRDYLSNAVANNQASAAAWTDARVELMSEIMVYGTLVRGLTQFDVGIFCFQLPLFKQCPELIHKK